MYVKRSEIIVKPVFYSFALDRGFNFLWEDGIEFEYLFEYQYWLSSLPEIGIFYLSSLLSSNSKKHLADDQTVH